MIQQIAKIQLWLKGRHPGVEIGAFKTPLPGIKPIYVDKYKTYANEECLADFQGEAVALPFKSNSLAYVASSHVLEHVANPVKALLEWYRVLRPGGFIYMVVPDRRYTWDKARALTSVEHFLSDYDHQVTSVDGTHIDDFVDNIDWLTYSPGTAAAEIPVAKAKLKQTYWGAVQSGSEINIHFHVFEPSNLTALIQAMSRQKNFAVSWKLVDTVERFPLENPNGILCVIKVRKTLWDRFESLKNRFCGLFSRQFFVQENAKTFATTS